MQTFAQHFIPLCLLTSLLKFGNFRGCTCAAPTAHVDDSPEDFLADWVDDQETLLQQTQEQIKTFKIVYNTNEIQLYINQIGSCADTLNVKTVSQQQPFFPT